jgi:hypothetical protein
MRPGQKQDAPVIATLNPGKSRPDVNMGCSRHRQIQTRCKYWVASVTARVRWGVYILFIQVKSQEFRGGSENKYSNTLEKLKCKKIAAIYRKT